MFGKQENKAELANWWVTDPGGQAGWNPPAHPLSPHSGQMGGALTQHPTPNCHNEGSSGGALTQHVGGHPQQGVEHVVYLPVPLYHVCKLLIVHEPGGCSGVWGDPLTTIRLP